MKNRILIIAILFALPFAASAQDDAGGPYPNIIKINPIGFALGNFNLSYERALSQAFSVQFGANYYYRFLGVDVTGFGVRAQGRFYVTNKAKSAPTGLYTGLLFSYNSLEERDITPPATVKSTGIGLLIGYQWVWNSGVALDLGLGPTIVNSDVTGATANDFNGVLPNFFISLGYNF